MGHKAPPPIPVAVKDQQVEAIRVTSKALIDKADRQLAKATMVAADLRRATEKYREREGKKKGG